MSSGFRPGKTPARAENDLSSLPMAPSIRENAARHRRHIEELSESLKKLGVNAAAADEHMSEIADRYRIELLRSMKRIEMAEAALNKGGGDG